MDHRTHPRILLSAALLLLQTLVCVPPGAAALRLRAERNTIAVLDESGRKLGAFVRPESDLESSGQETFSAVSVRAGGDSGTMLWRSSLDYEVEMALQAQPAPPRVEARVKVRNLSSTARHTYLYFPFEREDVVERPLLISFAADGDEVLPFEREMPGEGITAFWSTQDLNLARPDAELLLPAVAAQTGRGFLVAGCDPACAFAIRFHREVRLEFARRFFLPAQQGAEDRAPLSLSPAWNRPYTFFIGVAPADTRWPQLYRDWFLALNPERTHRRTAQPFGPLGRRSGSRADILLLQGGEAPPAGAPERALVEMPARAPSDAQGRPDEALRGSLILTPAGQPVPHGGGWKVNISPRFPFGARLLSEMEEMDPSRGAGVVIDTGPDENRVDRSRRLPPYPFFPHHLAAAELLEDVRKRTAPRGLLLAARTAHPASPALELADAAVVTAESDRLAGVRLAAGTLPMASAGPAGRDGWLRALFFGCVPPAEGPAGFPEARLFMALGRAAVTGGSPALDRLEFESPSGERWVTLRNTGPLATARAAAFAPSRTSPGGEALHVFSWSPADGLRCHGTARAPDALGALQVTMNLAPGDTGILFAVPSGLVSGLPYASLLPRASTEDAVEPGS